MDFIDTHLFLFLGVSQVFVELKVRWEVFIKDMKNFNGSFDKDVAVLWLKIDCDEVGVEKDWVLKWQYKLVKRAFTNSKYLCIAFHSYFNIILNAKARLLPFSNLGA
jgi:hypothetical protein